MVHLLTGGVNTGKTSLLERVLESLGPARQRINGFINKKVFQEGEFFGYDLVNLQTGSIVPFIRTTTPEKKEKGGRFYFVPEGLEKAVKIILGHHLSNYLIVDEVGPLELGGRGLWPALSQQLRRAGFRGLIVIRSGLMPAFHQLLEGLEIRRFDIANPAVELELSIAISNVFQRFPSITN